MWIVIPIMVVVVIVLVVALVARQPNEFRVKRVASMAAPAPVVFEQVNDLGKWAGWSPWEKLDSGMKRTFEGPAAGEGAMYSWDGNKNVGAGRMTITDSRPAEFIRIRLEFMRPFKATHTTEFAFKPEAGNTEVAWEMYGKNNALAKVLCLFMNQDKMIGGEFEKGLAEMKRIVEGA